MREEEEEGTAGSRAGDLKSGARSGAARRRKCSPSWESVASSRSLDTLQILSIERGQRRRSPHETEGPAARQFGLGTAAPDPLSELCTFHFHRPRSM